MASKKAKPRIVDGKLEPGPGVFTVEAGAELDFLHPHPVAALWGVGPATAPRLHRLGVTTVGDLAAVARSTLVAALGPSLGSHLHDLAWGRDDHPVVPHREVKSVGHEETYSTDLVEAAELRRETVRLADAVAARLRHGGLAARTVTVKVRFSDFATITRSRTIPGPVDTALELAAAAHSLLETVDPTQGVRLLGISASTLSAGASRQLSLDGVLSGGSDRWSPAWDEAWRAVDVLRRRFGDSVVRQGVGRDERDVPEP